MSNRAGVFFQLMAASLISTVIGVPFAWHLMKKNAFIPMILGVVFITLGTILCFFLPETLERSEVSNQSPDSSSGDEIDEIERPTSSHRYSRKKRILKMFKKMKASHFILKSPTLFALSITFLLQTLGGTISSFMFQLASERFHWSLGEVSTFSSIFHIFADNFCYRRAFSSPLVQLRTSSFFSLSSPLSIMYCPIDSTCDR